MTALADPSVVFIQRVHQPHATEHGDGPRLVATSETTDGEFGLFEIEIGAGAGTARPHYHTGFTESFYILAGSVRLRLGAEERVARAGDFAFVPRNAVHGFTNGSDDESARMLILFTPGVAREEYFREIAELYRDNDDPTPGEIDAVAARHDQINIRSGDDS